jgi:hypothetical protein
MLFSLNSAVLFASSRGHNLSPFVLVHLCVCCGDELTNLKLFYLLKCKLFQISDIAAVWNILRCLLLIIGEIEHNR